VRIEVDPGGLESPTFATVSEEIVAASPAVASALASASGGAGTPSLGAAIADLADTLATADRAAAISVDGLATAVIKAAQRYRANEAAIARAEMFR
jgi:hypothetical protein